MKDEYGSQFYKRVIKKRFPYGVEMSKKRRSGSSDASTNQATVNLNLSLSVVTLTLVPSSNWPSTIHFLSGYYLPFAHI